ncbi:hypothetical protein PHYBLDRAFT_66961 [Phycomyces blakesleeanus NRRL 1555(-)]|uniref:Uncharacterized protein n=1 Tax=Phycomyces blakesleeanus (strain ATCC 8743b / DSM 1359 / FGSC 10004 / NBRC 33097 / NRRL 1555) TaxID=763407 RepID=A0A163D5A8_PHYB8|nr:hypothetical protein PHYBLDRAFT_66961 [Phycomyces blakesleeanus NRRL 1555(-)]OAD68850.1 hypothetical protein PHYBLDRAFT_66961 [Phycomyces blakesleeanus NRRL 1555(-)]|eukprot:XP_018286890.1 hypothetical protein PHYBLDRAFT_66961 [Phycomyces blakesleeanus NRRL 1555(-)]
MLYEIIIIIEMKLQSVQKIKKFIQIYGNLLSCKTTGALRKVDEKSKRHLKRIIQNSFILYNQASMIWSAESCFCLKNLDESKCFFQKVGERYAEKYFIAAFKWGNGSTFIFSSQLSQNIIKDFPSFLKMEQAVTQRHMLNSGRELIILVDLTSSLSKV